jgi:caffeoyl-CoA O-methyltransferase
MRTGAAMDLLQRVVDHRRLRVGRQCLFRTLAVFLFVIPCGLLRAQSSSADARAQARLNWMRENQPGMWNVAPSEGQWLHDEIVKIGAKRALEVGTSNGYSGIWIALGLRETGGHLTTLEIDSHRAQLAQENFKAAGVSSLITLRLGDAREIIPRLQGPFDFVFIDAAKDQYVDYLQLAKPKVRVGGVIVAHNVTDLRSLVEDYIHTITTDPELKTTFVNAGPGGFSVSVKQK